MLKPIKILSIICVFCFCALAQQQKQENVYEPVKILSRAGANYTATAKKDGIEGNVKLRVTFLPDGKIGDVIDITEKDKKKLSKYGLTTNAIEAARKIRFVLAKRNGKAIAITKIIVYTFTLY